MPLSEQLMVALHNRRTVSPRQRLKSCISAFSTSSVPPPSSTDLLWLLLRQHLFFLGAVPADFSAAPAGAMLAGETKADLPPAWTLGEDTAEALILEEALLDDEMKERVMKRVELVSRVAFPLLLSSLNCNVHAIFACIVIYASASRALSDSEADAVPSHPIKCNAIGPLVRLCEGAEGPLEEIDPNNPPPPDPVSPLPSPQAFTNIINPFHLFIFSLRRWADPIPLCAEREEGEEEAQGKER